MIRKWFYRWLASMAFKALYRFCTIVPLSKDDDARAVIALDMLRKHL